MEVYDLHQHSECVIIHFGKEQFSTKITSTISRSTFNKGNSFNKKAFIVYNKQKTKILNLGNHDLEEKSEETTIVNNFIDELYRVFKKDKVSRDQDDELILKGLSDYIYFTVKNWNEETKTRPLDAFHYAFVVPSEWPEDIREELIRPIFIQSTLISKDDHKDRLLFISDIEATFYELAHEEKSQRNVALFKRSQNTVLARIVAMEEEKATIKLDLILTVNPLFGFPNSKLFPKVMRSTSVYITSEGIKNSIRMFIISKVMPFYQDWAIDNIVEALYNEVPEMHKYKGNSLMDVLRNKNETGWGLRAIGWGLNDEQIKVLESTYIFEILVDISRELFTKMKGLVSKNLIKEYALLVVKDTYSLNIKLDQYLLNWIYYLLEWNRSSLNFITVMAKIDVIDHCISATDILRGVFIAVLESIHNADIYCKPRILPAKNLDTSSSVFLVSQPNEIVHIDISLDSTILSLSLLDDCGLVKEIFEYNCCIDNNLPSISHFLKNQSSLDISSQFISFAETYLLQDMDLFSKDKDATVKEDIISQIESILNGDHFTTEPIVRMRRRTRFSNFLKKYKNYIKNAALDTDHTTEEEPLEKIVSIKQQTYFNAFLLMYMVYLKHIVSKKLSCYWDTYYTETKVGYSISIEKNILDNLIGPKTKFKELILTSGLVQKNDELKKLRVNTQGEGILASIKSSLKLELPIKSFFVLSQLHECYVQITLNQVVTSPDANEEEEQEAITLQDEIIPIQNIYESMCFYIWESIIEENSLIQRCYKHIDSAILELFSLAAKKEFTRDLKCYISNNILKENSDCQITGGESIHLSNHCSCTVYLRVIDIINLAFEPVLRDIANILSASLTNKKLFGEYTEITYFFSLIHFNKNAQFQNILAEILEDEVNTSNQEFNVETCFVAIPQLSSLLLRPVIGKQHFLYKAFKEGTLQQVFTSNYVFSFVVRGEEYKYKRTVASSDSIPIKCETAFPLAKRGDIISETQSNKLCYLKILENPYRDTILVHYYKLKTFDDSKQKGVVSSNCKDSEFMNGTRIDLEWENMKLGDHLPIILTVTSLGYSSSLQFSSKIIGYGNESVEFIETGEPMSLRRS